MRPVTIDPARGADQSVDVRVAPQGTIARVENMRIDKLGRLVLRNGYQSLGMTVSQGNNNLNPFDLYALDNDLIAAGNQALGTQVGIHGLYRYQNQPGAVWRVEQIIQSVGDATAEFRAAPAADSIRVILSELSALQTDALVCDCAALSDGSAVCMVSTSKFSSVTVTVIVPATGRVSKVDFAAGSNPRVLAIGTVFYVFYNTGTTVEVRTLTTTTQAGISAATVVATGTSAAPLAYDVANYEGTTDYLIAYPTGTGYTWRRFNIAHVQQTTTNVASLADAPVAICGSIGENVSVINVRAVSGAELRTFTVATGVLAVGPTNLDTSGTVMDWVGICRFSATQVYYVFHRTAGTVRVFKGRATIATHVLAAESDSSNTRPATKPITIDGEPFIWESLGISTAGNPYGLTRLGATVTSNSEFLSGIVLDGAAKITYSATTIGYKSQIAVGANKAYYAALVSFDPRDKTYRANLVSFNVNSGQRRQSVAVGKSLVISGGTEHQFDGRVSVELGYETTPVITLLTPQTGAGALTLLGVYTYQLVYRAVASNGDVTQSAPSAPITGTLIGLNNSFVIAATLPYSCRRNGLPSAQGGSVWLDLYRTEAGGSIPRIVQSTDATSTIGYGTPLNLTDNASDATQQTGAALYTQGADGSVSGRLPLGLASPGTLVMESDGKIIIAGLERDNQAQLSVESRPGEAIGFVNDDLFFIQNPEPITALCSGKDGRRYIFGRSNIRELVGPGPNAAGIGELSEPVEIENRVGAVDWRSVCRTEHGIFFQSSAADEPRIYLLPEGGESAIDASEGIRDLLKLYPVITSATRHDEEQLLTFTLQNNAGTDGRIIHLDLKTSGLGKNGWRGCWIIDRVPVLEGSPDIEIVEERVDIFPNVLTTQLVDLPQTLRVADRVVMFVSVQGAGVSVATITSQTLRSTISSTNGNISLWERIIANGGQLGGQVSVAVTGATLGTVLVVKTFLLRGCHATQAMEATTVAANTAVSWPLPTLTPTWGSAKNMWFAAMQDESAFADVTNPIIRTFPVGFGDASRASQGLGTTGSQSVETAYCTRLFEGTALSGLSFASPFSSNGSAILCAVRPLAAAGTPCRASVGYQGRLIVCNTADVLRNDAASFADGAAPIKGEWETADLYPMGTAGAGRHLMLSAIGELLGFCQLYAAFSYDGGVTWRNSKQYLLTPLFGFSLNKVLSLQWVPRRRKIDRVRAKIVQGDEAAGAFGATAGFAINQVTMWFEDLAGPTRATTSAGTVLGNRR